MNDTKTESVGHAGTSRNIGNAITGASAGAVIGGLGGVPGVVAGAVIGAVANVVAGLHSAHQRQAEANQQKTAHTAR